MKPKQLDFEPLFVAANALLDLSYDVDVLQDDLHRLTREDKTAYRKMYKSLPAACVNLAGEMNALIRQMDD